MAVFNVDYQFTGVLTSVSDDAAFTGSDTAVAGSTTQTAAANVNNVRPGTTTANFTHVLVLTITPADFNEVWSPGQLIVRARKNHASTAQGFQVRDSVASFTTRYTSPALTDVMVNYVVDLTAAGQVTGAYTIRLAFYAGTTAAVIAVDFLRFDGTYTPAVTDQAVSPATIEGEEAFGTATVEAVAGPVDLSPATIGTAEAFGVAALVLGPVDLSPATIGTAEAFGAAAVLLEQAVSPASIASAEAFGAAALVGGAVAVQPATIATGEAFGAPTIDQAVSPEGIASGEAVGAPTVALADVNLQPTTIGSAESFGTAVLVVVQPVDFSPEAIASGEAFGTPTVVLAVQALAPTTIGSSEAFGVPSIEAGVPNVAYPDGAAVAGFLGQGAELVALAEVHVGVVTRFAQVYARGNGFYIDGIDPNIAAVILAATARLVGNPDQLDVQVGTVRRRTAFKGWSLAERAVLDQYRGVAR